MANLQLVSDDSVYRMLYRKGWPPETNQSVNDLAFVIACVVSFRSLFVRRAAESNERVEERARRDAARQSVLRRGWQARLRQFHNSVLDTCKTLEGWSDSGTEMHKLPAVPSGLMTVDFLEASREILYSYEHNVVMFVPCVQSSSRTTISLVLGEISW
ncbi:hypothetical protein F5Y14DRAFT_435297 [Nemania sp. NC0429]|nr:hypothetical protein F5Y14DRAFT_435297 [Nemania sp. NC0429]